MLSAWLFFDDSALVTLVFPAWFLRSNYSSPGPNMTRVVSRFLGRNRFSTSPHSWVKRLGESLGFLSALTTYCSRRAFMGSAVNDIVPFPSLFLHTRYL